MNKTITIALASVAWLSAAPAHAEWYAGITAGESRAKVNGENLNAQFLDFGYSDAQTQTDTRGTAFRVFGGYQLNRYIGVDSARAPPMTSQRILHCVLKHRRPANMLTNCYCKTITSTPIQLVCSTAFANWNDGPKRGLSRQNQRSIQPGLSLMHG